MKLKKIEVFSKDELEAIHSASMTLLSEVGIKVDAQDTRDILKEKGATVDDSSHFVKFPESLVKEQLKTVPDSFKLHGPDGSFSFEVNTNSTQFATIGTPVKIYDPMDKKGVRKTVLTDTIEQIKIVDSLENIMCSHIDVWPNDVSYITIHSQCIYQWVKNTKKPYGLGCLGRLASQDMMNMASIIVGGEEELVEKPRFVGFMNPTSPLHLPQIMTNGFAIFTKYKQPTIIAPEALAGASAPVTLAGLLTQTNAEIVGSVVVSQIFNLGAPVFFGTVSHVTDMRSGNSAMGSVEMGLITAGIAQLARFYNIPSRGPGAGTDSKLLDLQNGYERFQTLMLAAQAGVNYITCAGTYEATLVEALELLVIDDDLVGMVKRAMEGIKVNDDTIAIDVIKKVATSDKKGVNFLAEPHTRKHMKSELYMPRLADRSRRSTWQKKGAKNIIERAREKVDKILEAHNPTELEKNVEDELLKYMKKVEARTFDDYRKAEGLMVDSVTLPDGIEIRDEK
ncbi:MAG TPA: trimethylamine methyltransferase family protein [Candidatus Nanopelagicaceae bacterium]|nr:trimethylamine methyltransferase family protein [Candidatus Nanopelagicaceae bacterium]